MNEHRKGRQVESLAHIFLRERERERNNNDGILVGFAAHLEVEEMCQSGGEASKAFKQTDYLLY